MNYGCIGCPLKHSFSREIHKSLADYDYILNEISADELDAFMRAKDFKAINVTIPHKQAVIPYLDEISDMAKEIGAVNTIVNKNGRLFGYNTDFFGMRELLKRAKIEIENKSVYILGTGGTSKTAHAAAKSLGAAEITKVSRHKTADAVTYADMQKNPEAVQIIINTTPSGMFPDNDGMPIDPADFPNLEGVADVVYNPINTKLVRRARSLGIPAEGGLFMLVAQALFACKIFTEEPLPEDTAERVFSEILKSKQSIVLTGMPSCGKTTVGKILANALGREFFDADIELELRENRKISDIFAENGEKYFRDKEAQIIAELSKRNGIVIATGGGAVLRSENVDRLKANGQIFFIDRAPELLLATPDRPLSSSTDAIMQRYNERYKIYSTVCDAKINGNGTPEENAAKILEIFGAK